MKVAGRGKRVATGSDRSQLLLSVSGTSFYTVLWSDLNVLGTLYLYRTDDRSRAETHDGVDRDSRRGRQDREDARAVDRSELSKCRQSENWGARPETDVLGPVRPKTDGRAAPGPFDDPSTGAHLSGSDEWTTIRRSHSGASQRVPKPAKQVTPRTRPPKGGVPGCFATLWARPAASLIGESISCRLFGLGRRMTRRAPGRESVWRTGGVGRKRSAVDLSVVFRALPSGSPHIG